jgi:hypothetical protein
MRLLAFGSLGLSLIFVGVLATRQGCQRTQAQTTQSTASARSFHEEIIGELSPGSEPQDMAASEHHVAWVEKRGDSRTVRLDGKQQGGVYQEVKYLEGSADETHLAFFGKRSSKWFLVIDGQERPQEYTKTSSLAFQPKGTSLAYCACLEKKCRLVVDGADTGAEYEDISYPQYSRDGKRLAYLGKRGKRWIVVVDGKQVGPEMGDYLDFGFDSDGNRPYVAGRVGNHWRLSYVVDGTAGPEFEVLSPIAFSSVGKHDAYGGTSTKSGYKKEKVLGTIVLDGQATATYEGKGISNFSWSPLSGQNVLAQGMRDFSPDFDGLSNPALNPEGKLVYAVRRDKGDIAVLMGSDLGPGFEEILSQLIFTDDSKHFVYVAKRGDSFVEVHDNVPGRTVSAGNRGPTAVEWIALTSDAAHVAYEIVSGAKYLKGGSRHALRSIVIDGQEGPQYDALDVASFKFDKEAHHYCYAIVGAKGDQELVTVDGHESKLYDALVGVHFGTDGESVTFVVRDGRRFLRVTYAFM